MSSRLRRSLHARKVDLVGKAPTPESAQLWANIHARHPRFKVAVATDARVAAARRGERYLFRSRLDLAVQVVRLMFMTEAFFALVCYRARVRCRVRGIPFLPSILDHLSIITGQININDTVVLQPGAYIPHGNIVLSGISSIGRGAYLSPWTGIGLVTGNVIGPTIGDHVMIGTKASVLGPVTIGDRATIGANSLVMIDVPADGTAVGVPGRLVGAGADARPASAGTEPVAEG